MKLSEKIVVVGINHLNTSVSARSRAVVAAGDLAGTLAKLKADAGLDEVVVLSTCSRVDVFAVCADPERGRDSLRAWFTGRAGAEIAPLLYDRSEADALLHLFRVASGLDSWIIGESEILAQVKKAYQAALAGGFTGRALNRAFQQAISAGKSVRAATGIQNGIRSIGGATALMAKRIFGEEAGGEILVFGAGQTAEAVVRHLAAKKFDRVIVANRTLDNARSIAASLGGEAVGLEEGLALLERVEVAVFSTSAAEPLLGADALARIAARRRKSLFLVDLGVPRNVDPECAKIDSVYLYDLDDLKRMIKASMEGKLTEKERAETLAASASRDCLLEMDKPYAVTANDRGAHMDTHNGHRFFRSAAALVALCAFLAASVPAYAADAAPAKTDAKKAGPAACLTCHESHSGFKDTMHGRKSKSSKKLVESCESCHGPGAAHAESGDASLIINPKKLDAAGVAETCFSCHKNKTVMMWKTSHHAQGGLSCLECHSVHEGEGRKSLKAGAVFEEKIQTEACLKCHKQQKSDMRLPSHHPIPEGKMSCVDCHNPHGGIDGNLKADSAQELCAKCHAEKAGPYANEHPPVSDSCLNCHRPHGSPNDKLLKQAQPYLCLNCHKFPHVTTQNGATGVAVSREEQRGNCIDCHKEIHGSDRKARLKD